MLHLFAYVQSMHLRRHK